MGEIRCSLGACALPRRGTRLAPIWVYVTGHLPRTHPLVENETLDDRDLEGVWLGNDLSTPVFWMYSFKLRKVVRLSDPRHLDHILPFLCPEDIPHRIDLSANDMAYRLPSIVATGKATSARSALTVSPVMPFNRMPFAACASAHVQLRGRVDGAVADVTLV